MIASQSFPRSPIRRINLVVGYDCPECGRRRTVFWLGVQPALPLNHQWRTTGPCQGCGAEQRRRVRSLNEAYIVEVDTKES